MCMHKHKFKIFLTDFGKCLVYHSRFVLLFELFAPLPRGHVTTNRHDMNTKEVPLEPNKKHLKQVSFATFIIFTFIYTW